MTVNETIINQTKKWITDVVIGCNFCPFAAREVKRNSIQYIVDNGSSVEANLQCFIQECERLDEATDTETSFIIYPAAFTDFEEYLDFVSLAEALLEREDYDGIYQVASFHPDYCFEGAATGDAANYTNRSVYPMLHILREASIDDALEHYTDPESIPERNIAFAKNKGAVYMKMLRDSCLAG